VAWRRPLALRPLDPTHTVLALLPGLLQAPREYISTLQLAFVSEVLITVMAGPTLDAHG
jgi:hypothetical protein